MKSHDPAFVAALISFFYYPDDPYALLRCHRQRFAVPDRFIDACKKVHVVTSFRGDILADDLSILFGMQQPPLRLRLDTPVRTPRLLTGQEPAFLHVGPRFQKGSLMAKQTIGREGLTDQVTRL